MGQYEADYYYEAVHKRLKQAEPPMHETLIYPPPHIQDYSQLEVADVLGRYQREPVQNEWHTGEIREVGGALEWENDAAVSWSLSATPTSGVLETGEDCPYDDDFHLQVDAEGTLVTGFRFNGELYARVE